LFLFSFSLLKFYSQEQEKYNIGGYT